jgi:hypothetical protein
MKCDWEIGMPIFNEAVTISEEDDVTQLTIQGNDPQTNPLQSWQAHGDTDLARLTGDGRFQIGSFDNGEMATDDALIEAHRHEDDTTKPKRGFHLLGTIKGTLNAAVSWIVHELILKGTTGITAAHTALRVHLRNEATGTMGGTAELRGGDIEVLNTGANAIPTVTGIQVKAGNSSTLTGGTTYGVKVEVTSPRADDYALHTTGGKVHLGGLGAGVVHSDANGDLSSSTVTASDIGTGAVTTAKLADDAVTLAKLAHGTANKFLGFDGSGVPAELNGGGGGAISLLGYANPGSNQTSITFTLTGLTVSTLLISYNVSTSHTADLDLLRLKINGDSDEHYYNLMYWLGGYTPVSYLLESNVGYQTITFVRNVTGQAYQRWVSGQIYIHNCLSTTLPKEIFGLASYVDGSVGGLQGTLSSRGSYVNGAALSSLAFSFATGNILAGSWIKVLGVADS